jgi:hypothetical protein
VSGLSLIRFCFLRDHVSPYSISVFGCFSLVHQVHFSMLLCRYSSICAKKVCNVSLGTINSTQPIKHMFIVPGDALHQLLLFCLSGHFSLFHHAAELQQLTCVLVWLFRMRRCYSGHVRGMHVPPRQVQGGVRGPGRWYVPGLSCQHLCRVGRHKARRLCTVCDVLRRQVPGGL